MRFGSAQRTQGGRERRAKNRDMESADDATLAKIAPTVARAAQHNAYHIAEMVTVRKMQGTWNPENGVK